MSSYSYWHDAHDIRTHSIKERKQKKQVRWCMLCAGIRGELNSLLLEKTRTKKFTSLCSSEAGCVRYVREYSSTHVYSRTHGLR